MTAGTLLNNLALLPENFSKQKSLMNKEKGRLIQTAPFSILKDQII